MEYSTFEQVRAQRSARKINCKKVLLWTSVSINVVILLLLGYNALPVNTGRHGLLGEQLAVADTDKDGEVTKEEVEELVENVMHDERAHGPGPIAIMMHEFMPQAIQKMDQNRDGVISGAEAMAMGMGMLKQALAGYMHPQGAAMGRVMHPADHEEYMEIQHRVENQFKDAVIDLAIKNKKRNMSNEECFGECFHRAQWLLDPRTAWSTCNEGCGSDFTNPAFEMEDALEHIREELKKDTVTYGESETNYTISMKKPGLKAKNFVVEVRHEVLVIQGEYPRPNGRWNITHQFHHAVHIPADVKKSEITSELEDEVVTVTMPKDPTKKHLVEEQRKKLEQIAQGKTVEKAVA